MACPMNCTSKRVASIAAMTVESLKSKLDTKATAPRNKSETCGNFFCGWTRGKMEKKMPSSAAAYATREYPRRAAKMDAKAIHNTSMVATRAAKGPEMVSTKVLTRNCEFWAFCQGTTPRMLVCMAR